MSLLPSDATADADLSAFTSAEIAAAEDLLRHSKARNTWATYRSAWKRFTTWCESRSVTALPASPQTVALYLGLSSNLQTIKAGQRAPRYKASTLRLWLVAIRQMHSANRLPDPTTDPLVTHAMDAVTRVRAEQKEGPRRVAPLLLSDISHITKSLGYRTWPDGLLAYRDSAVLWLGFVGAFRRSELSTFTVGDLRPTTEGLRVRLPFSKTNHTGEPQWNAIPFGSHPGTCPVCAIRQWVTLMDLVDGTQSGLLSCDGSSPTTVTCTSAETLGRGSPTILVPCSVAATQAGSPHTRRPLRGRSRGTPSTACCCGA